MSRRIITGAAVAAAALLLALPSAAGSFQDAAGRHLSAALEGGLEPVDEGHLALAFMWQKELADRAWALTALDRLAAARPMDPLMRDEVRSLRARFAVAAGHIGTAREIFRAMGGLERWWVRGPFPVGELADFKTAAVWPPRGSRWRRAAGTDALGWVRISGLAWPTDRQLVYLASTVRSRRDRPVAVHLGAAQVARVWINGRECLTTPEPLRRGEDQVTAGGWLRRGSNVVAVAVASEQGQWWLRLRLTAPDGGPLSGVVETGAEPRPVAADPRPAPPVRGLGGEIEKALEAARPGAALARAAFMVAHRPAPVGSGRIRQACRQARGDDPAGARLLEALVTDDPGEVQKLLAGVLADDPGSAPARLALARWYHDRDLDEQGHDLLAGARDPALAAADLDMAADRWGPVVLPRLRRLAAAHRACLAVQLAWTRRALDGRRWQDVATGLSRLEKLAPARPDVVELRRRLALIRGDAASLKRLAELGMEEDPNWPQARIDMARLLTAEGKLEQAASVLGEGLRRCPTQVDLLAEMVRLEHMRGNDAEARALVERLVALRPQDRSARRFEKLLGAAGEDEGWRRSAAQLRRLAARLSGDRTVTVLEHHEVRFLPGNLTQERVQRVLRVGDAKRAEALRRASVAYVPERERLRVLAARVLRRDGGESSADQSDTPRLADPAINMYYDSRLRILRYPELERGDLVELTYVLSETAEANETGPYRGGILLIPTDYPILRAEVELSAPKDAVPAWELANLEGEPKTTTGGDGTVHLAWTWTGLPEAPLDIPAPPPLLTTPYIAYSNHPSWAELGDWYARHIAPRVRPSTAVEERAKELTAGIDSRRDRIAALYHFVTDRIRYVALEFGEHRFRPFSADWVLTHRMGDCKDKAALLVALCRAVGIPAEVVLVRTADLGPARSRLAVLEDFNHAIVYLPEDHLWLDGTATGYDPFRPPGPDQGAWVLVVRGAESALQTIPVTGVGVSRTEITLGPSRDGSVPVSVHAVATGDAAASLRAAFAGTRDPQRFARWLQGLFPGAALEGEPRVTMPPGRDPATMELAGEVPHTALLGEGGVQVFPGSFPLLSRLAPTPKRSTPLLLPTRPDVEWTLTVRLGRAPGALPPGVDESGPFGSLKVTVEPLPDGYRIHGRFHLEPGLVPPDRLAGLRSFLLAASRTFARHLEAP